MPNHRLHSDPANSAGSGEPERSALQDLRMNENGVIMRVQVFKTWNRVRSSFWFLPAVMAGGAMVSAFATVALDTLVTDWLTLNWGLNFTGGAEGASSLLGAIAGSMITIAGVVFSMTLVALSLASSQLGPPSAPQFHARHHDPNGTRYVCRYLPLLLARPPHHPPR